MTWIGDYSEDFETLNFKFSTTKNEVPFTLAGSPVISVYESNSVTQITGGITLTVDFDSVTGLNNVLIDLSADALYVPNKDYHAVITTGTIDGVSVVGRVPAMFSIHNRRAEDLRNLIAGVLRRLRQVELRPPRR